MSVGGRWAAASGVAVVLVGVGLVRVVPFASATTSSGDRAIYEPLAPVRIFDTRQVAHAPALAATATRSVTVVGVGGVPPDATAVVLNVTVTQPTRSGFLTVHPADVARPGVSNLNFAAGVTIPNLVTVKLGTTGGDAGKVKVYNGSFGTVHVLADVSGYYRAHDHDDRYSLTGHDHAGVYAPAAHNHDAAYAPQVHNHDAAYARTPGSTLVPVRGDGTAADNGAALRAAMTAITDATAAKAYVLALSPGTYDLGATIFTLKPFVSLLGAGRNATLLTSSAAIFQPNGAVTMGNGTEMARLTLTNTHATAGSGRPAVAITGSAVGRLVDVKIAQASPNPIAVLAWNGVLDVVDSAIRAESTGTTVAFGVFSYTGSTVRVLGSEVELVAGGATNEGAVSSQFNSVMEVRDSSISAPGKRAVRIFPPSTQRVANTRIDGLTTGTAGAVCFDNYDANFAPVSCTA